MKAARTSKAILSRATPIILVGRLPAADLVLVLFDTMSKAELFEASLVCMAWYHLATRSIWRRHRIPFSGLMRRLVAPEDVEADEDNEQAIERWVTVCSFVASLGKDIDADRSDATEGRCPRERDQRAVDRMETIRQQRLCHVRAFPRGNTIVGGAGRADRNLWRAGLR